MANSILVTEASGNIGSGLIEKLTGQITISVRGFVRTAEKTARIEKLGASSAIGSLAT